MESRTSVVIVNWNGEEFLRPGLDAIRREQPAEVIVVDNASNDKSLVMLPESYPEVRVISNRENKGFGAAANQAIQAASSDFVLLLNVDTQLLEGSLQTLQEFLIAHPEAAIAAPRLLFPDGKLQLSCRRFPTPARLFFFLSYLDRLLPSGYRLNSKEHENEREVEQPMGAALLLRKSALEQTGNFDERFFLYMEEVDLCARIKKAGWKIFYVPGARVIHHAGGSAGKDWERSQGFFFSSVIRYFVKQQYSALRMLMLKCSLSAALLIRSTVLFFAGRWRQSKFYGSMSGRIWSLHG